MQPLLQRIQLAPDGPILRRKRARLHQAPRPHLLPVQRLARHRHAPIDLGLLGPGDEVRRPVQDALLHVGVLEVGNGPLAPEVGLRPLFQLEVRLLDVPVELRAEVMADQVAALAVEAAADEGVGGEVAVQHDGEALPVDDEVHRFVSLDVDSDTAGVVSRFERGVACIFERSGRLEILGRGGIGNAHRFPQCRFHLLVSGALDGQAVQTLQDRKRHHEGFLQRFRHDRFRAHVRIYEHERDVQHAAEVRSLTARVEEQFAQMWQVVLACEVVVEDGFIRVAHEIQYHEPMEVPVWDLALALGDYGEFALHEDVLFEGRP